MKNNGALTATVFDIERCSFSDGPGIRTTVFFKGCNLRCAWCHNPESQRFERELLFYADKCTACGKCRAVCPSHPEYCTLCGNCELSCPHDARKVCGKQYTVEELFAEIEKDNNFYRTSSGGVTFSGGEAMLQLDFLCAILKKCKENGISTAVDTAGHIPWTSFERVMPYTDLFLYDVKSLDSAVHEQYTGVGNELILDNLATLFLHGARVWIRVPVVPSVNDSEENILALKDWLADHGTPEKIELLPYHRMGERKAAALGREPMAFEVPDAEKMRRLRALIADFV